tara:strand:+ start:28 stop:1152 length:1125 start_codon:yes stop_codon:yes gene_type:complete
MAIPLDYYNIFGKAPEGKVLNTPRADANYYFGIQDPFLLYDTNRYFMDAPVPEDKDEGIVTLPIDTNVISQGGGEGEREELGPVSPRKRNTGDGLFEKSLSRVNNTGGITNAPIEMEGTYYGTPKSMVYNPATGRFQPTYDYKESPTFVNKTLRAAPDVFDVDKVGIKDPSIMKIANYNDLFTDERFSLPENIQKRNKGIFSIRDFLPGGKFSLSGMAISGLKGINDRIQSSNLAKSTSLADYRDMMSYGGYEEREKARQDMKDEAAKIQAELDKVKTSEGDRNMGKDKDKDKKSKGYNYGRDSTPNNPNSTKNKTKSKGYNYADTPGGGRDGGGGGDHDGGASAGAQGDDAAGAGGYRKGGRVKYLYGGLTSL